MYACVCEHPPYYISFYIPFFAWCQFISQIRNPCIHAVSNHIFYSFTIPSQISFYFIIYSPSFIFNHPSFPNNFPFPSIFITSPLTRPLTPPLTPNTTLTPHPTTKTLLTPFFPIKKTHFSGTHPPPTSHIPFFSLFCPYHFHFLPLSFTFILLNYFNPLKSLLFHINILIIPFFYSNSVILLL